MLAIFWKAMTITKEIISLITLYIHASARSAGSKLPARHQQPKRVYCLLIFIREAGSSELAVSIPSESFIEAAGVSVSLSTPIQVGHSTV
jgi:hypothetical protein